MVSSMVRTILIIATGVRRTAEAEDAVEDAVEEGEGAMMVIDIVNENHALSLQQEDVNMAISVTSRTTRPLFEPFHWWNMAERKCSLCALICTSLRGLYITMRLLESSSKKYRGHLM